MVWVITFLLMISSLRIYDCYIFSGPTFLATRRSPRADASALYSNNHNNKEFTDDFNASRLGMNRILYGDSQEDKALMGINGEIYPLEPTTTSSHCSKFSNSSIVGGSFGDIMSSYTNSKPISSAYKVKCDDGALTSSSLPKSGLVTDLGGTLQRSFGPKTQGYLTPLERIALTANGNLQRIFSSYYDAPVHILVKCCEKQQQEQQQDASGAAAIWHRQVLLTVHSQIFCTASSVITVQDPSCIHLVETGQVGIGQLFRYLDKLPSFELLDVGRSEEGGMWRQYELSCKELTCHITETFVPDAWNILPPSTEHRNIHVLGEHDLSF